jgi:hypothetical protein
MLIALLILVMSCSVPEKLMKNVKKIAFTKVEDTKLERDISEGKVTLESPWVKISRMCNALDVAVPDLAPPDPSVELQVTL